MKIGYQGIEGSNSEEAAKLFIKRKNFNDYELVPLIDSESVITELKNKRINYGVVATKNSTAGTVKETFDAIKNEYLELVDTCILPIHHCLFKKKGVDNSNLKNVVSHIQALNQTKETRKKLFPNLNEIEFEDTAKAACDLSQGIINDDCAVICKKEAGLKYDLELVMENIEDRKDNRTEFRIFKLPTIDYENKNKPSFKDVISYVFSSERGINLILKIFIVLLTLLSIFLALNSVFFKIEWVSTAVDNDVFSFIDILGYLLSFVLLKISDSYKVKRKYKSIIGYWKYYSLSSKNIEDEAQQLKTPRIVQIYEQDGSLKIKGVICDKENVPFFESDDIIISNLNCKSCKIVYFYNSPKSGSQRANIKGIASLEWQSKYYSSKVNKMEGDYFGTISGDEGQLTYLRISEEEYEAHRKSTFI